jgi:hypothetical protein
MRVPPRKPGRQKRTTTKKRIAIREGLRRVKVVSLGRIGIDSEVETQTRSLLRGSKYNNMRLTIKMTCGRDS